MLYVTSAIVITITVAFIVASYFWYEAQLNEDDEGDTLSKFMSEW